MKFKREIHFLINENALAAASYAYAEATGDDVPADAMWKALHDYEVAKLPTLART